MINVPEGYRLLEPCRGLRVLVREEIEPQLISRGLDRFPGEGRNGEAPPGQAGGRGAMTRAAIDDGPPLLIKFYRRGGLAGRFRGDTYRGVARPLNEVRVCLAARSAGLRVPPIQCLWMEAAGPFRFRLASATREIPDARNVFRALGDLPAGGPERRRLVEGVARAARRLHDAGIDHPDLNLGNILVAGEDRQVRLIDFDRARLTGGLLPERARHRALARIYRSLVKLSRPEPVPLTADEKAHFLAAYWPEREGPHSALSRRCRRELKRHQRWWRLLPPRRNG